MVFFRFFYELNEFLVHGGYPVRHKANFESPLLSCGLLEAQLRDGSLCHDLALYILENAEKRII